MRRRFATVDVFTTVAFGGNPLAVMLDADGLSTAQMQAVAREFNYVETTFVLPPNDAANTAQVRIFTPDRELPFAGHPNVGTAFVLARQGEAFGRALGDHVLFEDVHGFAVGGILGLAHIRHADTSRGNDRRRFRENGLHGSRLASTAQPASNPTVHSAHPVRLSLARLCSDTV